ncbi:MAG: T9SS type A sorting domain-containing protein [Calditrichota bacterium]
MAAKTVIYSLLLAGVLFGLGGAALYARPSSVYDTRVTRDLTGAPLPTRADYLRQFPEYSLTIENIERSPAPRDPGGTVVVVINRRLYEVHQERFATFTDDIGDIGYQVVSIAADGGAAQELKDLVRDEGGDDLTGVIFAGEQPLAWYEHLEWFYHNDRPDNERLAEYPIDLFFMDTDGVWEDTSGNDIYDWHHGSWEPDIWLGRLPGYNLGRVDEDTLIANYLDRVHAYRTGQIALPHRALNMVDDDWIPNSADWTETIRLAIGGVFAEADPESTSAVNYRHHLTEAGGYELVQVAVHSSADSHLFYVNGHSQYDYFRFRHLRDEVAPEVMFYNLFACSAMNLSRNLCLGALYALRGPYGLGAVGSAKTGSMLFFEDYYRRLSEGECFGDAFRLWFTEHGHEPGRENWARSWFYGMTYYGDPTLTLRRGLRITETTAEEITGDGDGVVDASETAGIRLTIVNLSPHPQRNVQLTASIDDPWCNFLNDQAEFDFIDAGDELQVEGLRLQVSPDCPDNHRARIAVEMTTGDEETWGDEFSMVIRSPRLETVGFGITDMEGVKDGLVEPGESGLMSIQVRNSGGDDMRLPGYVSLSDLGAGVIANGEHLAIPLTAAGSIGYSGCLPFQLSPDQAALKFAAVELWSNQDAWLSRMFIAVSSSPESNLQEDFNQSPIWFSTYSLAEGYQNAWVWSDNDGEEGGGVSFKGSDTLQYPPHADAALELPLMMVQGPAVLALRHRFEIEAEYDAAVVEVDRGRGWQRVAPDGGYNGVGVDNGSFAGGPCWNGSMEWTNSRVDLGDESGPLRVRLRFASDNGVEGAGWFIDRLTVSGRTLDVPPSNEPFADNFAWRGMFPNPTNGRLTVKFWSPREVSAEIAVRDISGRIVLNPLLLTARAGFNQAAVDIDRLPSGIYLLSLEVERASQGVQKVVLFK